MSARMHPRNATISPRIHSHIDTATTPTHPLTHAETPLLYEELRGSKRGAGPKGNSEMRVHTHSYYNKEPIYESGRYVHLTPLLLSAPSHAPSNQRHFQQLKRGRIIRFGPGKACGVDLVVCVLDPYLHTQSPPRPMALISAADLMSHFGT